MPGSTSLYWEQSAKIAQNTKFTKIEYDLCSIGESFFHEFMNNRFIDVQSSEVKCASILHHYQQNIIILKQPKQQRWTRIQKNHLRPTVCIPRKWRSIAVSYIDFVPVVEI
jgi:hypothetical protein